MQVISKACVAVMLATIVLGQPASSSASRSGVKLRPIDLSDFPLKTKASYVNAADATESDSLHLLKRANYVDTARALVEHVASDVEFRLVDDHSC